MNFIVRIWRVLKWTLIALLTLVVVTTIILSVPTVQTRLAQWGAGFLESTYGVKVEIGAALYRFPNRIHLYDVYAPDHRGDTLIHAEEIRFVFTDFADNRLYSEYFALTGGKLFLRKYEGDSLYNMAMWLKHFESDTPSDPDKPEFGISAREIDIVDLHFIKVPMGCDSCTQLNFQESVVHVLDFDLSGSYVSADIQRLRYKDPIRFNLHEFRGQTSYQANHMELDNMVFITDASQVSGSIRLEYRELSDFSDFVNKVRMRGRFSESVFSSAEFQSYLPMFPSFDEFRINGRFQGTVNNIYGDKVDILIGKTEFFGDVHLTEVTDPNAMYLDAFVGYCKTSGADLQTYVGPFLTTEIPDYIRELTEINLSGHYDGTLRDFNTHGDLKTNLGRVDLALSFRGLDVPETATYSGNLELDQFDVGALIREESLGLVSASGKVEGRGLTVASARSDLNLTIPQLEFMGYSYSNVTVDGSTADRQFKGDVRIRDAEVTFDFAGEIDFSSDTATIDFTAILDSSNLMAMGFVTDSATWVSATIKSDFRMYEWDWWQGLVILDSLEYWRGGKNHGFNQFVMTSSNAGNITRNTIDSDLFSGYIEGEYRLLEVHKAFLMALGDVNKHYPYTDEPVAVNCEFQLELYNTEPITALFAPGMVIEPGTEIWGRLNSADRTIFTEINTPGMSFTGHQLDSLTFHLDGKRGVYRVQAGAKKWTINDKLEVDRIGLNSSLYPDSTDFQLHARVRDTVNSDIRIAGWMEQTDTQSLAFSFREMVFNVGEDTLSLNNLNKLTMSGSRIAFENFNFEGERSALSINGFVSEEPHEILRVNLDRLDMSLINYFLRDPNTDFRGVITGDMIMNDLLGTPNIAAGLEIDSLVFNGEWIGDVHASADWGVRAGNTIISVDVLRGVRETMSVEGTLQPDSTGQLDLKLKLDRFRIAALNPYLKGILDNLRGMLEGEVHIGGRFDRPQLDGTLTLPSVAFSVPFMGTDYNFEGSPVVHLSSDRILLDRVKLRDTKTGSTGYASGYVAHNNLKDVNFNLQIDARELLSLDTKEGDNNYFYGTAYTSGLVRVTGPTEAMKLVIDIEAEKGTRLKIPLTSPKEIHENRVVTFIDSKALEADSVSIESRSQIKNLGGLSIEVNVNMKPDAEVQLMMDEAIGGEIAGKGDGLMRILVSSSGELTILGTYTVSEGYYLFNMRDLIQKRFDVLPGSSLMWTGDPLTAQVDLNARYTTRALLWGMVSESSGYSGQRVRVDLLMHLTGNLMNPNIEFEITVPGVNAAWQEEINNRLSDKDRKMDNAFSLLITNSFWNPEGNIASGVYQQNVTQLYSVLSSWMTRAVFGDYIDVSLDYNTYSDENIASEFEVGVSKAFFDDRVIINSNIDIPVAGGITQSGQQQTLTGDVEVEYKITEDGRFRARVFNRSNQNNPALDQLSPYTQGAGVFYRIDFNGLGDLRRRMFGRKEKEVEEVPGPEEQQEEQE